MQTVYHLNADDLDINILNSIKAQFMHKEIELHVIECDDTEYLLSDPANREFLLRAKERVENGVGLVVPDQEQFRCE